MRLPSGNPTSASNASPAKHRIWWMVKAFGIALAVELLLVIAHGTIPLAKRILPLGGSDLAQLGVLLGLAAAYTEFVMLVG